MEAFKSNSASILLATEAAGMGCDISNVLRVVQYGFPDSLSSMVQRLGRAARDPQLWGIGILLAPNTIPAKIDDDLRGYVDSPICRRQYLDTIFHNTHQDNVNCCDICHPDVEDIPDVEVVLDVPDVEIEATQDLMAKKRKAPPRSAEEKLVVYEVVIDWREGAFELHYKPFMYMTMDCLMTDAMARTIADKSA
ncbi:ATP-dependent DNA helicase sgs1, partial [Podila horticola]